MQRLESSVQGKIRRIGMSKGGKHEHREKNKPVLMHTLSADWSGHPLSCQRTGEMRKSVQS